MKMIHQIDSHELNNLMYEAQKNVTNVQTVLKESQEKIWNTIGLVQAEINYQDYCLEKLKNQPALDVEALSLYDLNDGVFSNFYYDVHARFIKEPLNLFNVFMPGNAPIYFREDVSLYISVDGKYDDITECLKHESLQKRLYYKEFSSNRVKLVLELKDYQKRLGPTRFNIIELDSFLPGSYKIENIVVYRLKENAQDDNEPIILGSYPFVGKNRIVLDQKYQFYRIEFEVIIDYYLNRSENIIYPFGLKHIYLYDADFDADSHLIVKYENREPITYVKDDCKIYTNKGMTSTTLSALDIELYLEYNNNTLSLPFEVSTPSRIVELPIRTTTFFARIPLKTDMCLSSIVFNVGTQTL